MTASNPTTEAPTAEISSSDFRRACGQFATGVTVVTARDGDGVRGMTANSFTSVSLEPPLILVSVDRRNRTHGLLETEASFVVNVLAQSQRDVSDRFAGRHGDLQHRFDDLPHHLTEDGVPVLDETLVSFVCRREAVYPGGDHSLFLGRVERIVSRADREPLLFYAGGYRSLPATT